MTEMTRRRRFRATSLLLMTLATISFGVCAAMLPPDGKDGGPYRPIVVGPENKDPYPDHGEAIEALGRHFNISLNRDRCFPYRRD